MSLTLQKIQKIERKARKRKKKQDGVSLQIPDIWENFARMCKVRSGGNIIPFEPYPYQIELTDLMLERSVVVVKSRQLGISETITCFMLWRACLNPGYLGLVFSKTQTDSSLLARRMKRMIASLGLKTTTENLSDIEIEGRGRILFRNSKPDSARGIESVVDVFLDELAFLETGKEVYDALAPAMQMVGDKARVFAVSTPNGKAGFYWDLLNSGNGDIDIELTCTRASKGEDDPFQWWIDSGEWGKILIHWKAHPIYGGNPNFLEEVHEKQKLSWQTIHQEYNLSFQESESNYFSAELIRGIDTGNLASPEKESYYFAGIDTSTTGEDYCICIILKVAEYSDIFELVHIYRKKHQTSEYHLYYIEQILKDYKPISTGIEVTGGVGQIYLEKLSNRLPSLKFQSIRTTGDSKPTMCERLKLVLEKKKLIIPKKSPLIDELLNFKRNGKQLEAAQGKHDDIIMALSFSLTVAELEGF